MSKIILWRVLAVWLVGFFSVGVCAEGNIQFSQTLPAVIDTEMIERGRHADPAIPMRINEGGKRIETGPGVSRVIMPPVTPEASEKAIHSQILPEDLVPEVQVYPDIDKTTRMSSLRASGDTAPVGPASIAELARALRNDVDLIYEYVHNTIAYYPTWGIHKGAMGALLDNQGTAFDQATLMVQLLRQSGYTASYVKGGINLTAAQIQDWFGISTHRVCAVLNLFAQARIPVRQITANPSGSCPGSTAALTSMKFDYVWVKVRIGSTDYHFDPSFKSHTHKNGINLASASSYNASNYLTSARSGATIKTDYVQGINRTNIRNNLTSYANNLATHLRTHLPAGTLDDVIGGKTITPHTGGALRQTSLPYQDTAVALTEWTSTIPLNYMPTLRIQYQGINKIYPSEDIYGKRLTITYNSSNRPELRRDGTIEATGTAVTSGAVGNVTFTVTHGAYATAEPMTQTYTQQIKAGGTYLIGNGWGPAGRGMLPQSTRYRTCCR